ncbi:MAG: mechanosensitive ion channel family protein [Flavobacteriales bacterium]|nr:mechanosensitive ion channel family protein [Flavobacteriales bacterium]
MKKLKSVLIVLALLSFFNTSFAQIDSLQTTSDSTNIEALKYYNKKLAEIELQRKNDSIKRVALEIRLNSLKTTDNLQKENLLKALKAIEENEKARLSNKKARIDSLRNTAKGYPVIGALKDTLMFMYLKLGASSPKERATNISNKILNLYKDDFIKLDSIFVLKSENTYDIVYGEMIIMSISENDAIWYDTKALNLANEFKNKIIKSLLAAKKENSLSNLLLQIGLVLLVLIVLWFIIKLIGKGSNKLNNFVLFKKDQWLKNLSYKDYTFLTAQQELEIIMFLLKILRWFIYALLLYITLPIIFSIFPFSRHWADALFQLIWSPFKQIFVSIWNYLPNLFSILVIYFVMNYFIRFIKYVFSEIANEKLKISGFHADWAMPTLSIIKFLLYAFMFVLIFPFLPGSNSNVFQGVSVFIGILFSFGSSSAITNIIAGLVITYMRPFKIGDRIKIGEITGDVLEKTLLVTRIKTIKNEIITIPNSSVLSGNTTNYSSYAKENGLIIYTTVTIGYDVPWKNMHQALIEAALRTELILKKPAPFVLQTSLEDFYVSYQINAYTKEASKQALIYSNLHQNIQDVCNERGIEIMSPHYRAARDGNQVTIPADYLNKDYKAPSFNINIAKDLK